MLREIKGWMQVTLTLVICLISAGQFACLEQIDLPAPPESEEALVIQGSVFKSSPSVIYVSISQLFTFTSITQRPVNAKLVEVIDEDGVVIKLPELGEGNYRVEIPESYPGFSIDFGRSYQLHVIARDGREYFTNFEPLYEVIKPDSLSLELVEVTVLDGDGQFTNKKKIRVSVSTTTVTTGIEKRARLKWVVERTYRVTESNPIAVGPPKTCYLTENVLGANLQVIDGNERTNDRLDKFKLYEGFLSSAFGEGAYVHVYQQSISAGAYEYWNQAKLLIERTGNMFEPPAGVISTNLVNLSNSDDLVFGYFYCYAQDTMRVYVSPDFALNPAPSCPPPGGAINQNGDCTVIVCCDCLSHPRSTTMKPAYWTE